MVKLSDILKTDDIIKVSPQDNLSSALSKLTTSHDAVFVFVKDEFKGIVNPYYDLIKSSYPGNAKVEHCLFHPPIIKKNYPLSKVVELLIESRIHYLPVFDEQNKFAGIISARRILIRHQYSDVFKVSISEVLRKKSKPLITVLEDDPLVKAIGIFKDTKISKLIVVDKNFKVKGILTHYDIIKYLVAPKDSMHRGTRLSQKTNFHQLKVKQFSKSYVLTLSVNHSVSEALNLILTRRIGSVVIIDKDRHPIGIITTRDLLKFLIKKEQEKEVQLISRNLSEKSRQIVGGFFNHFIARVKRVPTVEKAKLLVVEEKQGNLFKVVLSLIPKKGPQKVIQKEGRDLNKIFSTIKKDKA